MNEESSSTIAEDYQKKKWGILFDYLDIKRDGILEYEEYMSFPQRLLDSGKTEHAQRLRSVYHKSWELLCDILKMSRENQTIDKPRYISGMQILTRGDFFLGTFLPTITEAFFDCVDTDHNGFISLEEWRCLQNYRGNKDEAVVRSMFTRLDRDGDGRVSRDEMIYAFTQFGTGQDPSDDYSFLYALN